MKHIIEILALALSLCVGLGLACIDCGDSSLSMNVNMYSGTDTFSDYMSMSGHVQAQGVYKLGTDGIQAQDMVQIGPGCADFYQATQLWFTKSGDISDDPYMDISKGMSNTGSGIGYATMQFSDTGYDTSLHSISLVSGLQTNNKIESAWLSSTFTNYADLNSQASINWQNENVQALAGLSFNRWTDNLGVTPLQVSLSLTPFAAPTGFPLVFT
jgi:hypothetical protein